MFHCINMCSSLLSADVSCWHRRETFAQPQQVSGTMIATRSRLCDAEALQPAMSCSLL